MGRVSVISVLAGALTGLAGLALLTVLASTVVVGINGGTNFASWTGGQFKTAAAVILVAAMFLSFMLGGYVSGRMSRRGGATHGLLAGVIGAVLAAVLALAVVGIGADTGLARVARHIQVADTWNQWRYFILIGALVAIAAFVLGGLVGGVQGERWHGKLLARAVDPTYGPEAEERAEARKRLTDAEVARLASANHVARVTATSKAAQTTGETPTTTPLRPVVPATPAASPAPDRSTVATGELRDRNAVVNGGPGPADTQPATEAGQPRSRHHLLGRR
ncbi:MAG: YrzE family protein [Actinomycetota bacterium]|nr:YrzE family protein [Actinomycetota bacterium]MDQ6949158.1 YrzE family protein [Actinomycetota bacterium]